MKPLRSEPGRAPRIVIAPDAFKGTLSAQAAAAAMAAGVRRVLPAADIRLLPVADGGEGTLDALLAATAGERRHADASDAAGRPLRAEYAVLKDGTAAIEVARIVGFGQPGIAAIPLAQRTTRGVGELMRHCLDQGMRRFLVGLGGSSTNDAGAGMLAALGMRATESDGRFVALDLSGLDARLRQCRILLLADVDNPLCGERGASAVYGPQKGAGPDEVPVLDARLRSFAALADAALAEAPGTGAAGGLGYALQLIGGEHHSGAEMLLALLGFDAALEGADWVLTGEGRSDAQTLQGKAPLAVARHARAAGVPVALVAGTIDPAAEPALAEAFDLRLALAGADGAQEAMRTAADCLADATSRLLRGRMSQ